jgi:hypothetical protein
MTIHASAPTVSQLLALLAQEVRSWPGVTCKAHRFGGTEFRLGRREIGHSHVGGLVDVPFPRALRDELVGSGRAAAHHVLPRSGWVSYRVRGPQDLEGAVALLRLNYDRLSRIAAHDEPDSAAHLDPAEPTTRRPEA